MAKTLSQILSEISSKILTGGRRTTATNTRSVLNDIADSSLNKKDGGLVIETLTGYTTTITPTDDKHLATKKYVDDHSITETTRYNLEDNANNQDGYLKASTDAPTGILNAPAFNNYMSMPNVSNQRLWYDVTLGEAMTANQLVCYIGDDRKLYKASTSDPSKLQHQLGLRLASANGINDPNMFITYGYITLDYTLITGYTAGYNGAVWLTSTGTLTITKPASNVVYIGTATRFSSGQVELFVNPEYRDVGAGGGGGISEPTTDGNWLRSKVSSTYSWVEGVLKSTYDSFVSSVNATFAWTKSAGVQSGTTLDWGTTDISTITGTGSVTINSISNLTDGVRNYIISGYSSFGFSTSLIPASSILGNYIAGQTNKLQVTNLKDGEFQLIWSNITMSGGGSTNLTYTASPTNGVVNSDTGTDATIPSATSTQAGLMNAENNRFIEPTIKGVLFTDDYNRADSASLGSNWTQTGTTQSIVSNKRQLSSAVGSIAFNNYARYTNYGSSNLELFTIQEDVIAPTTINSTSFGVAYGFRSIGGISNIHFAIGFDFTTTNKGKITFYFQESTTNSITGSSVLPIAAGDNTTIKIQQVKNTFIVSWKNNTDASTPVIVETYTFDMGRTSVIKALPNTFSFTTYTLGGTFFTDNLSVTSNHLTGAVYFLTDSIGKGYSAGDITKRTVDIIANSCYGTYQLIGNVNNKLEDVNASEVLAHSPSQIVIMLGTNNHGAGDTDATIITKIKSLISALTGYSIAAGTIKICTLRPRSDRDVTGVNTLIRTDAAFVGGVLELFYPLWSGTTFIPKSSLFNEDLIHPNADGFQAEAQSIIRQLNLPLKTSFALQRNYPTYQPNTGRIAIGSQGNVTPNATIDVTGTSTQIRMGTNGGTNKGAYLLGTDSGVAISCNADYNGTNYIARETTASQLLLLGTESYFSFASGATIGNSVATTKVLNITSTGIGVNLGGTTTPASALQIKGYTKLSSVASNDTTASTYALDVVDTKNQIRVTDGSGKGGYILGISLGCAVGGNIDYNGTSYIARDTTCSQMVFTSGFIGFNANIGATIGSSVTPNRIMTVQTGGVIISGTVVTNPTSMVNGLAMSDGTLATANLSSSGISMASISGVLKIRNHGGDVITLQSNSGWTALTGTSDKTTYATYSATAGATYTQSELQGAMDAIKKVTEHQKALIDMLLANGLIKS